MSTFTSNSRKLRAGYVRTTSIVILLAACGFSQAPPGRIRLEGSELVFLDAQNLAAKRVPFRDVANARIVRAPDQDERTTRREYQEAMLLADDRYALLAEVREFYERRETTAAILDATGAEIGRIERTERRFVTSPKSSRFLAVDENIGGDVSKLALYNIATGQLELVKDLSLEGRGSRRYYDFALESGDVLVVYASFGSLRAFIITRDGDLALDKSLDAPRSVMVVLARISSDGKFVALVERVYKSETDVTAGGSYRLMVIDRDGTIVGREHISEYPAGGSLGVNVTFRQNAVTATASNGGAAQVLVR